YRLVLTLAFVFGCLFFFFFQAEDGIRDFHVTGVQTCALPIWVKQLSSGRRRPSSGSGCGFMRYRRVGSRKITGSGSSMAASSRRSEERRVGKEWRSRWSPEQ